MQTPPPRQPHAVPPDPPAIVVEADAETAARIHRHAGPQRDDGCAVHVIDDVEEELSELIQDREDRDRNKRVLEEATAELAEEYARPVIDRRKDRERHKDRDR